MTAKEKRSIQILGLVFVVLLLILILLVRTNRGDSPPVEETDEPVHTSDTEDTDENTPEEITVNEETFFIPEQNYTDISWTSNGLTLTFTLNEQNEWKWADNIDFPLESATVLRILHNLETLTPLRTITEGDTLESYGLQNPSAVLTAHGDKQVIMLTFGNIVSDGYNYYMLLNDDTSTVYTVPNLIYQDMQVPIYDMCQLPEFPDLWDESNIQSVRIEAMRSGVMTSVLTAQQNRNAAQAENTDNTENTLIWMNQDGQSIPHDNETLDELLTDFAVLEISQCIDYMPAEGAEEICGFTEAILTLEYTEPQEEEQETIEENHVGEATAVSDEVTTDTNIDTDANTDSNTSTNTDIVTDTVNSETHMNAEPESKTLVLRIGGQDTDRGGRYVQLDDSKAIYLMSNDVLDTLMQVALSGLEA